MTRDELLTTVLTRIAHALERGNTAYLTHSDVRTESDEMMRSHGTDPAVLATLALLHALRIKLLGDAVPADETQRLLEVESRLGRVREAGGPPAARTPADSKGDHCAWMAARFFLMLHGTGRHPEALDRSVTLFLAAPAQGLGTPTQAAELAADLAYALNRRFETRKADIPDLTTAIDLGEWLVAGGAPEGPGSQTLLDLGHSYHLRFVHSADVLRTDDLDRAQALVERARTTAPAALRPAAERLLGVILLSRYQAAGARIDDLKAALVHLRRAAASERSNPAGAVNDLCVALAAWFRHTRETSVLDEASGHLEALVATEPKDDPDYPLYLSGLGVILAMRGEARRSTADLTAAVGRLQQALALFPDGHPRHALTASQLSEVLRMRALSDGGADGSALDRAVEFARRAVAGPGTRLGPGAAHLHLSNALAQRYHVNGDLADLEEAVETGEIALNSTPLTHPGRVSYLVNQSVLLYHLHLSATPDSADTAATGAGTPAEEPERIPPLDRAIDRAREAADSSGTSPHRTAVYSNLANMLRVRYMLRPDRAVDLADALKAAEEAVGGADAGFQLSHARVNLAVVRHLIYEHTHQPGAEQLPGSREALALAWRSAEEALPAEEGQEPVRAQALITLGRLAASAHTLDTGAVPDALRRGVDAFHSAALTAEAPAGVRAFAAVEGGTFAAENGMWDQAAACFDLALELLGPLTEPVLLGWESRELHVRQFSGVADLACAAHLRRGRPDLAITALDLGRGIMLAPAWGLRSTAEHMPPKQAARYVSLIRASFEEAGSPLAADPAIPVLGIPDGTTAKARSGAARRRRARDLRNLLADQGLRHPYQPLDLNPLRAALGTAAAVSVHLGDTHSTALILTAEGTTSLELPDLTREQAVAEARFYLLAARSRQRATALASHEIMEWLWDALAGPVLEHLGHGPNPRLPGRIWWIPSGALSLLPLHAAGYHREAGRPRTVLDRVVSSYSVTLRALARDLGRATDLGEGNSLLVTHGRATGAPHPRFTAPGAVALDGPAATRQAVLDALPHAATVHFTCHGRTDAVSPANSRLALHDGPLRFADVAGLDLPHARLAYLAACETAWPGDEIEDEAIHLCSAFQLAGFPHVIGTLWQALAAPTADITRAVYAAMNAPNPSSPAEAVHRAVLAAREKYARSGPAAWAAHAHFGP
ncbi:CHAT domain-containing protein [Streptomyces sp. NPDC055005]